MRSTVSTHHSSRTSLSPRIWSNVCSARRQWIINSQPERSIFRREHEREKLDSLCKGAPVAIQLILGPRSCGKTKIIKSYLDGKKHAVYIDCRGINAADPESFVEAILGQLMSKVPSEWHTDVLKKLSPPLLGLFKVIAAGFKITPKLGSTAIEAVTFDAANFVKALPDLSSKPSSTRDLNDLFVELSMFMDAWEEAVPAASKYKWPVLVIDEANCLMSWNDQHPQELATLLRFFVRLTKQESRCHVLLATSDYAYQAWLNKAIGPRFWAPKVIGDFQKGDAREFLEHELRWKGSTVTVDDSTWTKVYEVCGGNAGALTQLAVEVNSEGDWDTALKALWKVEAERIKALALGREGWYTAAQYADAAVKLLDATHHAVAKQDMQEKLGRHVVGSTATKVEALAAGEPVLRRLAEANALSVRPDSDWAQDIPAEVFEDTESVVTAPSAMDLYCIRRMRPQLEKTLQEWEQQKEAAAATETGQTPRSASPSSSPDVQAVQKKMEEVEKDITDLRSTLNNLDKDIYEAKKQGDKEEVASLRAKENLLMEKEKLLMDRLKQLGEEKLVLLRANISSGGS